MPKREADNSLSAVGGVDDRQALVAHVHAMVLVDVHAGAVWATVTDQLAEAQELQEEEGGVLEGGGSEGSNAHHKTENRLFRESGNPIQRNPPTFRGGNESFPRWSGRGPRWDKKQCGAGCAWAIGKCRVEAGR